MNQILCRSSSRGGGGASFTRDRHAIDVVYVAHSRFILYTVQINIIDEKHINNIIWEDVEHNFKFKILFKAYELFSHSSDE